MPTIRLTRLGAFYLTLCALVLAAALWPQPARAQAVNADLSITADADAVNAGDAVLFTVTLKNTGDQPATNLVLDLTLAGPVDTVRARLDEEATTGVNIAGIRRSAAGLRWRGGIAAQGQLVINLRVTSSLVGEDDVITLTGAAGRFDAEPVLNASKSVDVKAYDLNPNDLSLTKSLLHGYGTVAGVTAGERVEVLPREEVGIQLELTNNSDVTVYTLLVDEMAQQAVAAARADADRVTCKLEPIAATVETGRGFRVPVDALSEPLPDGFKYGFLVKTEPGETSRTVVRARIVGTPDCIIEGQAKAYSTAVPSAGAVAAEFDAVSADSDVAPKLRFVQRMLQLQPKLSALVAFLILLSDFGDAPDSTNHFGAIMEAYPGVNAAFPTVFDPATGADRGPKHKNGIPVRLGDRISGELVADVGLLKNIDPPTDTPNLDLHDDGVDPSTLNFQHCFPTAIDVAVTVNQTAVDYVANNDAPLYLNIWLDGNHDGDWQDRLDCDGLTAVEHIVIDQELRPSAVGRLNIVAPTGNIPVLAEGQNETMWLRVTISDEPSEKTDQFRPNPTQLPVDIGDGRGPANGFRWGETEDYLYVPAAVAGAPGGFGADLQLESEVLFQDDFLAGTVQASATDAKLSQILATLRARNIGDRIAGGSKLVITSDPYLGIPTTQDAKCCYCLTCTVAADVEPLPELTAAAVTAARLPFVEVCQEDGGCYVELALGDLPPGQEVGLLLGWDVDPALAQVELDVSVQSAGDSNPGNNVQRRRALRLFREPTIVAPMPGAWRGCLTCTVAFKGFGHPGTDVTLFSEQFPDGSLSTGIDANGFWQIDAYLPDGTHDVTLGWTGCLTCTVQAAGVSETPLTVAGEPLNLTVDRTLLWNPASFSVNDPANALHAAGVAESDDSCGPWQVVDDAGRMDLDGWKLPVWPGKEVELSVELFCAGTATATLTGDGVNVAFSDGDGDGIFTAAYTALPELDANGNAVTLTVTCDNAVAEYSGTMVPVEPSTVVDAVTGAPLGNMEVTLFGFRRDVNGVQVAPWEAQAFGQLNPQTTGGDGAFAYLVPQGRYGLQVVGDGYQSVRVGPFRSRGVIAGFNIGMPPTVSNATGAVVEISEDGFVPATLEVAPGTAVEWRNLGLDAASTQSTNGTVTGAAAHATSWDSGLLLSGEAHKVLFSEEGTFTYIDAEDPSKTAVIRVAQPAPPADGNTVFLPLVLR
ncbi:MAG: DUF11 domain-containing protein [Caldilineaceae bacterium]|nr:DUF11 domain-containing protein [Caldilineaceae bacterium]